MYLSCKTTINVSWLTREYSTHAIFFFFFSLLFQSTTFTYGQPSDNLDDVEENLCYKTSEVEFKRQGHFGGRESLMKDATEYITRHVGVIINC